LWSGRWTVRAAGLVFAACAMGDHTTMSTASIERQIPDRTTLARVMSTPFGQLRSDPRTPMDHYGKKVNLSN
jgi:hypothetical protein